MFSDEFLDRHRRSDKNFVRRRKLPFHSMILFLMNLIKGAIQDELDQFFKVLLDLPVVTSEVTKSAFCKARKKLRYTAFLELNDRLIKIFYETVPYKTWRGFRVMAIDGSTARLPGTKEVHDHFGGPSSADGKATTMARLSHMFDVLNDVSVHAMIAPHTVGERNIARSHIERVGHGDLLLLDRGYPAFWLFALILSRQAHFCARARLDSWQAIVRFMRSGLHEQIVTLCPDAKAMADCRKLGLSTEPIRVRLVRVALDSGETEVLITSMGEMEACSIDELKGLYHLRWGIEERYKVWKSRIQVENWSGKSVESVYQDFHAKILALNLTIAIAQPVGEKIEEKTSERKYRYQLNLTNALSKMKDTVVLLFTKIDPIGIIRGLHEIFLKTIEPIRPGRKYPRKPRVGIRTYAPSYKPVR